MSNHLMPNWLRKRAELSPDRLAVIDHDQTLTFAELDHRVQMIAQTLLAKGIRKGDHVALLYQNGLEMIELIHALEYVGAVMVLLNIRLSVHELCWQMEDAEINYLIYDPGLLQKVGELKSEWNNHNLTFLTYKDLEESSGSSDSQFQLELQLELQLEFDLNSIHTIIYTSGTSGHPKGVLLSYGNHWWSAIGSALNLGLQPEDRWLACVPMFHVSGLSILMRSVIYGITVVVQQAFDPQFVNAAIKKEQVSIISVVTSMLTRMIDDLHESGTLYPATFRCMLLGGGPAPLPVLEACKKLQIPVYQTYGMTETASQIVTLSPEYMFAKLGSAGKPLFQAQLKILAEGMEQAPFQAGEIVVKGANVTTGYWNREDATIQAIQAGWLFTGDIGYLDHDGFLYVLDRRNDLIISGGENIYPAEIEAALVAHPAILDAGVTGFTDPAWGQVPVAFVKVRPDMVVDENEIVEFCSQKLARYKIPKKIYVVEQLPRNASHKLLRRKLPELLDKIGDQTITEPL